MKTENKNEVCDISQTVVQMDKKYWQIRWEKQETGWDIGYPAPAITKFIDGIVDKNLATLIPGCGNAYEAEYLVQQGFTNITLIDIAPMAVNQLKQKFINNSHITILLEDFFEHKGSYDLVLEQTFFCAIPPFKRKDYVVKMHEILNENGRIVGVLFDKQFNNSFPPFGGCPCEYRPIFENHFVIKTMEPCYNSIFPRQGSEVFIHFIKNKSIKQRL